MNQSLCVPRLEGNNSLVRGEGGAQGRVIMLDFLGTHMHLTTT
jgi:hypothetical protein